MDSIVIILIVVVGLLFLKVKNLQKHLIMLSFSERLVNKILSDKGLITHRDIETSTNEFIGNMPKDESDKIIKIAKSLGILIPDYMTEEELEAYIKVQESLRNRDR